MNRLPKRRTSAAHSSSCAISAETLEVRSLLSAAIGDAEFYKVTVAPLSESAEDIGTIDFVVDEKPGDSWFELGAWIYNDPDDGASIRGPISTYFEYQGRTLVKLTRVFDPESVISSAEVAARYQHVKLVSVNVATEPELAEYLKQFEPSPEEKLQSLNERFPDRNGMTAEEYPWLLDIPLEIPDIGRMGIIYPYYVGLNWDAININDSSEFDWSRFADTPWNPWGAIFVDSFDQVDRSDAGADKAQDVPIQSSDDDVSGEFPATMTPTDDAPVEEQVSKSSTNDDAGHSHSSSDANTVEGPSEASGDSSEQSSVAISDDNIGGRDAVGSTDTGGTTPEDKRVVVERNDVVVEPNKKPSRVASVIPGTENSSPMTWNRDDEQHSNEWILELIFTEEQLPEWIDQTESENGDPESGESNNGTVVSVDAGTDPDSNSKQSAVEVDLHLKVTPFD